MEMAVGNKTATWLSNCSNRKKQSYENDVRCLAIFYARTVSASLSITGCCVALFMIVLYRKYRSFTNRMIVYVLLPSMILSVIYVYPHQLKDASVYCQVTGYIVNTTAFAQRLLIVFIVIHLLLFTIKERRPKYLEHVFLISACIVPPLISIVPFIGKTSHYGYAGDWCWIRSKSKYEDWLRFLCLYLWLILFIVVEFVCFTIVIVKVRKHLQKIQTIGLNRPAEIAKIRQYKKQVYPLLCYPLVNMVLAIPVTTNRIQNWINPDEPVFGLYLAHCTIYPLWGFFNAMMYFVNRETIEELHPRNVWEHLTTWRRSSHSSLQRILNTPQSPRRDTDEDYTVVSGPATTTARDGLHSVTMVSSDME